MNSIIINTDRFKNYLIIKNKAASIPTFFLHGFTGTSSSWNSIIRNLDCHAIALDLPGHGNSQFLDLESNYNILDWCHSFNDILSYLELSKINICGYSMGGRLAIAFAAKYPYKIEKLILESTSLGIYDYNAKKNRFENDLILSNLIKKDLAQFTDKWEGNPLFFKQKNRNEAEFLRQRAIRLSHDPIQLSKALEAFSQGAMDYYETDFSKFNFPITIINGSEDSKYIKSGKIMSLANKEANQYIVDRASHNVHLENPDSFIELLKK